MSNNSKFIKKKLYYIFLPFVAILLAVGIAVDCLYSQYSQVMQGALGEGARASQEYIDDTLANSRAINILLEEEGAVLMKNDVVNGEKVLPIKTDDKTPVNVNVYGILSAHHYAGGTGSGSSNAKPTDLKTALESVGYKVNDTIWNMLAAKKLAYESSSEVGKKIAGQYEISINEYESTMSFASAHAFSEYAIVTFGTNGGEGSDGDRGETNSLELGGNEIELLKRLDSEGFKVIVLMNSSYVMELGPVIEYADAVLWIGGTGLYGMYGAANLLCGKANPSGRLPDTWMYEQETSSSYYTTINDNSSYVNANGAAIGSYTNYNEGIYIGYKWYETADAEGYWDGVDNDYGIGYDGVIAYPFGYGLSYTEFTETITSAEYDNGTFTFTVNVENTKPDVAGKDVVELYVEKPYTNGGVEVSKVELAAFDKTDTLDSSMPSQVITFTVNEEDLASYDVNANDGKGSYVLLDGEYKFYISSGETGAHCWKAFDGDETRSKSFPVTGKVYAGENKRESDVVAAENRLEVTDNDSGIALNDATAGFNELSRKDGFANAVDTISAAANTNGNVTVEADSALAKALAAYYSSNSYTSYNTDHLKSLAEFTDATTGAKKQYVISDLWTTDAEGNPLISHDEEGNKKVLGAVDYDDPRWEQLISQMSVDEMQELIGRGGYGNIAVESIGKIAGTDYDGPTGYSNFLKATLGIAQETTGFCAEPIMAGTRNVDLITDYGRAVGREGNAFGNTGWYAPGMNMHRTAFGGRTGEYFSEDSLLTGLMAASVASGAFEKGVYTYAKHFAFNELETHRSDGMNCVMSEQAAREIYLRPFEIGIKQGKINGLMVSFMFCNAQWVGGNYNLVGGIVRGEWGFKGVMNTDLAGPKIMGAEKALCAGTDMLLATSYGTNKSLTWVRCDDIRKTDEGICAMKTATKHILYAFASAQLNRDVEAKAANTSGLQALYVVLNIVGYLGAAVFIGLFIWFLLKDLRQPKAQVVDAEESVSADVRNENVTNNDTNNDNEVKQEDNNE